MLVDAAGVLSISWSRWTEHWLPPLLVLVLSISTYALVRWGLLPLLRRVSRRSAFHWDDILVDETLLRRIASVAAVLVALNGVRRLPLSESWIDALRQGLAAVLTVLVMLTISALLTTIGKVYRTFDVSRQRPIKGYLQIGKLLTFVFGAILLIAVLTGQTIGYFVTGLGAMTAVLLLIFKDTILSLVASIQLTQNDMVRVGDWIEMPGQNADGDVVDIALHTVKVQNWDKTITTIPTSKLISDSFRNWRFMSASGGRRIKRSIHIDVSSVRFLTEEEVERFSRFAPLREYMERKRSEIGSWNQDHDPGPELVGDPRRLTNLGTLRAYVDAYLRAHPGIHHEGMTLLVRQLQPGPHGIPLELYAFTKDTAWASYEAVQADILDHIFASMPEFGLRAYQAPAGADLRELRADTTRPDGQ